MILKYALKRIMTEVIFRSFKLVKLNAVRIYIEYCRFFRLGTGNSKSLVGKVLLRFKWKLKIN